MNNVNVVAISTDKNYISKIKAGNHELTVDEPIDKGGLDTAATPMDLLGGSLASCTTITLQMYMNFKEIVYKEVKVTVDFEAKIQDALSFKRHVIIIGNIEDKQQQRLLKVANSCPVHKILERGHEVLTTIEFISN